MSRSFKKNPGYFDHNKWAKRQANKVVRRYKGTIPRGKAYQKIYESWEICDYGQLFSWEQYCRRNHIDVNTKDKEHIKKFKTIYLCK